MWLRVTKAIDANFCLLFGHHTDAVSYTHLDVYKRQTLW